MTFYWVNQGLTYEEEVGADCLWAPIRQKNTWREPEHWRHMAHLRPGDIVFNYAKPGLMGYCKVLADAV